MTRPLAYALGFLACAVPAIFDAAAREARALYACDAACVEIRMEDAR
jgi:hypothetical protein